MAATPPSPSPGTKVCVACGEDCSGRPRMKDQRGRYLCQACAAARAAAASTQSPGPPVSAAPSAESAGTEDDAPIALAPEEGAPQPTEATVRREGHLCPACSSKFGPDSVVCIHCGFDRRKGFQRGTGVGATRRHGGELDCPNCGYSLRGLKSPTCPECGERISPELARRARRTREDRKAIVKAYAIPLGLLAVGGGVAAWSAMAMGAPLEALLIVFAVEVVLSVGVYIGCAAMWMGFASALHLTVLQIASCLAFMEALRWTASTFLRGVPIGCYGVIVVYVFIMVLTALVMAKVMDLDPQDAALVCTGIALVAFFTLPLMQLMGWV